MISTSKSGRPTAARMSKAGELRETVQTIVVALFVALVIKTLIFQPFTIPSASEEPNLYEGDYVVVAKWPYGYSRHSLLFSPPLFKGRVLFNPPRRGDVIVFKLPSSGHVDYIKRLVGLPGDRLQVRSGRLYINDKALAVSSDKAVQVDDRLVPELAAWRWETNPEGRRYPHTDPRRWGRVGRQHRRLCRAGSLLLHDG